MTYIRGVQVSYGKFSGTGEIFEAVKLNDFGDLDQAKSVCTNFYIPQNDFLTNVSFKYNLLGIAQLTFTTFNRSFGSYGLAGAGDSTASYNFSVDDYFFFGF